MPAPAGTRPRPTPILPKSPWCWTLLRNDRLPQGHLVTALLDVRGLPVRFPLLASDPAVLSQLRWLSGQIFSRAVLAVRKSGDKWRVMRSDGWRNRRVENGGTGTRMRLGLDTAYLCTKFDNASFSRSRDMVVAHQNLNSLRGLITYFSAMVCHPWTSICYYQPTYQIWSV